MPVKNRKSVEWDVGFISGAISVISTKDLVSVTSSICTKFCWLMSEIVHFESIRKWKPKSSLYEIKAKLLPDCDRIQFVFLLDRENYKYQNLSTFCTSYSDFWCILSDLNGFGIKPARNFIPHLIFLQLCNSQNYFCYWTTAIFELFKITIFSHGLKIGPLPAILVT